MTQIIYYSKTGNTKKAAERIGELLGNAKLERISADTKITDNTVYLGGPVYGGKIHPLISSLINASDLENKRFYIFVTSMNLKADRALEEAEKSIKIKKGMVIKKINLYVRNPIKRLLFFKLNKELDQLNGFVGK